MGYDGTCSVRRQQPRWPKDRRCCCLFDSQGRGRACEPTYLTASIWSLGEKQNVLPNVNVPVRDPIHPARDGRGAQSLDEAKQNM